MLNNLNNKLLFVVFTSIFFNFYFLIIKLFIKKKLVSRLINLIDL